MSNKQLNKELKYGGNHFKGVLKDTDGDKSMDVLDCQYKNKNKQGWMHDAAARAADRLGASKTAERFRERGEQKDELDKIRREERFTQEKETSRFKQVEAGRKARERIKSGQSRFSGFSQGLASMAGPAKVAAPVRRKVRAAPKRKYTKRKTTKRRTTKRKATRRAAPRRKAPEAPQQTTALNFRI